MRNAGMSTTQQDFTTLAHSCGCRTIVRLSLDAERAANEIVQLTTSVCLKCDTAPRFKTHRITWADANRSR
jgi:hypothetical protein